MFEPPYLFSEEGPSRRVKDSDKKISLWFLYTREKRQAAGHPGRSGDDRIVFPYPLRVMAVEIGGYTSRLFAASLRPERDLVWADAFSGLSALNKLIHERVD